MSENDYSRLAKKLDNIAEKVAAIDEKLTGYADIQEKVYKNESEILLIKQKCAGVQDAKAKSGVPWGNVKSGLIVGVVVGLIMAIANMILNVLK
jgi:tetrahydromethanopterin S-methyltransferase subunit G